MGGMWRNGLNDHECILGRRYRRGHLVYYGHTNRYCDVASHFGWQVKIKSVVEKRNQRGSWWLIKTDEPGRRGLATTDMFKAALAERARDSGSEVRILTSSGWFYDTVSHIALVEQL